mgnify:CR=1 FL=1
MEEKILYRYDQLFKDVVISLLESGEIKSIEECRRRFLINGHQTVQKWLRRAGKEYLIPKVGIRTLQLEITRLKEYDDETYKLVSKHLARTGVDIN